MVILDQWSRTGDAWPKEQSDNLSTGKRGGAIFRNRLTGEGGVKEKTKQGWSGELGTSKNRRNRVNDLK